MFRNYCKKLLGKQENMPHIIWNRAGRTRAASLLCSYIVSLWYIPYITIMLSIILSGRFVEYEQTIALSRYIRESWIGMIWFLHSDPAYWPITIISIVVVMVVLLLSIILLLHARDVAKRIMKDVIDSNYKKCLDCGHPLAMLPARQQCPECGREYKINDVIDQWKQYIDDSYRRGGMLYNWWRYEGIK